MTCLPLRRVLAGSILASFERREGARRIIRPQVGFLPTSCLAPIAFQSKRTYSIEHRKEERVHARTRRHLPHSSHLPTPAAACQHYAGDGAPRVDAEADVRGD